MEIELSPKSLPMAPARPMSPVEDDFESDSYSFHTYVPLSSFPTPPPSAHSRCNSTQLSPRLSTHISHPELLGPAIHLSNLIPSAVSLLDPSTQLVHSMLVRAQLPTEVLALACCILDSLNSKSFALSWRRSLPLRSTSRPQTPMSPKHSFSVPSRTREPEPLHIDDVRPELVILSALTIAVKFLDDQQAPTSYYAEEWAQHAWTCEMINSTEQAIMANLQYRILPLTHAELLRDAQVDMERAGQFRRESMFSNEEADMDISGTSSAWGKEDLLMSTPAMTPPGFDNLDAMEGVICDGGDKLSAIGLGIHVVDMA